MFQPRGHGWSARRPGRSRRGSRSSLSQSRYVRPPQHHEVSDGGILESTLLQILYKSHPDPVPIREILKSSPIKYKKLNINQQLYQMQEKGLINRFDYDPPQWFLLPKGTHVYENKMRIANSSAESNTKNIGSTSNQSESNISFSAKNRQSYDSTSSFGFLKSTGATISQISLPTVHARDDTKRSYLGSHTAINEPSSTLAYDEETTVKEKPLPNNILEVNDKQPSRQDLERAETGCCSNEEESHLSDLPPLIDDDDPMDQDENDECFEHSPPSSVSSSMNVDGEKLEESRMIRQLPVSDKSNIKLDQLGEKIFKVLNTTSKVPIADFVKMFKGTHSKKQINQNLYGMEKRGLVSRSQENPPMWFLQRKAGEMLDKMSFGSPDLKNVKNSSSDSCSTKSTACSASQYSAGLLGRRPVSSLSTSSEQSCSRITTNEVDFESDLQFPDQYLKQMEAVAISSHGNEPGSCSLYQPFSDPSQLFKPLPNKIPRLDSNCSFRDSTKNPVSQLMEYVQANRLKIDFKVNVDGPDHRRRFYTTVTLGSETYTPIEGQSKKDSKTKACEYVLDAISRSQGLSSATATNQATFASSASPPMQVTQSLQQPAVSISAGASSKNAVSLVNEYAQANNFKIEFQCDSHGPDHKKSFRTVLTIDRTNYPPVEGASKKDSKLKAAEAALLILQSTGKLLMNTLSQSASGPQQINTFHDRVAKMVNDKFHSLLMDLPDTVVGRKILAGFVMSRTLTTDAGDETQWMVVSIGSGNRCVGGDKLSMKGDTVNDCHAEVIARRGLLRFLYREIQDYRTDPDADDNILTASGDGEKLTLKAGIEFHLYISTAPCGDSALFAKSDLRDTDSYEAAEENHGHRPLFENKKQGILRTKVENGEGCIPIDNEALVPTWDGLLRGERLRTMSCSDKIAKWNFVGLQGALLSHFLEPFYMSSLTLGMLYSHGHLTRAVCCRVEKFMKLYPNTASPMYKVHHPKVAKVSGDDPSRDTGKMKTREYSLNWIVGDDRAEVLDGTKGRCEARYGCLNPVSQVSKSSIYAEFKKVSDRTYPSYSKAKEAVPHYKQAAEEMKKAFDQAECGSWMSKPSEVEEF